VRAEGFCYFFIFCFQVFQDVRSKLVAMDLEASDKAVGALGKGGGLGTFQVSFTQREMRESEKYLVRHRVSLSELVIAGVKGSRFTVLVCVVDGYPRPAPSARHLSLPFFACSPPPPLGVRSTWRP